MEKKKIRKKSVFLILTFSLIFSLVGRKALLFCFSDKLSPSSLIVCFERYIYLNVVLSSLLNEELLACFSNDKDSKLTLLGKKVSGHFVINLSFDLANKLK